MANNKKTPAYKRDALSEVDALKARVEKLEEALEGLLPSAEEVDGE